MRVTFSILNVNSMNQLRELIAACVWNQDDGQPTVLENKRAFSFGNTWWIWECSSCMVYVRNCLSQCLNILGMFYTLKSTMCCISQDCTCVACHRALHVLYVTGLYMCCLSQGWTCIVCHRAVHGLYVIGMYTCCMS